MLDKKRSDRLFGYLLFFVSGYLIVLGIVPHIALPVEKTVRDGVADPQYLTISILTFILAILLLYVVIGIYISRYEKFGLFGLMGFIIALTGSVLNICMLFDMSFVWPVLIVHTPELIDFSGPLFRKSIFSVAHNLVVYLGTLGYLVFGISMIHARVFHRLASLAFTIGMPLAGVVLFPPFILRTIGCMLTAVSLVWIGVSYIKGNASDASS